MLDYFTQQLGELIKFLIRDAKRAREHRALARSRSHTNSECSSSSRTESSSKPRARQTNNSLASATGQIIIQPSRQKLRTSQVYVLHCIFLSLFISLINHVSFLWIVENQYCWYMYNLILSTFTILCYCHCYIQNILAYVILRSK